MSSSPTVEGIDYPVHSGLWINWSRGAVFGPTLTLAPRDGDLLIAFTALFVALVSNRGWRIVSFALHRYFTTPTPQDAVYHQSQAILRNYDNQTSIVQLVGLIGANYRRNNSDNILKASIILLIATIYITLFTVAGGFSSHISTGVGTDVLIKSLNCGYFNRPVLQQENRVAYATIYGRAVNDAANYAQQCYSNNAAKEVQDCSRLPSKQIKLQMDKDAGCPFQGDICRASTNSNLIIDSGFVHSDEHFGLNLPTEGRMSMRKVLHCAPIKTEGYTSKRETSFGNLTFYHYGTLGSRDYMATAMSLQEQYANNDSPDTIQTYSNYYISTAIARVENGTRAVAKSGFVPIDAIFRKDADILLVFLSGNGVSHTAPSGDLWYRVSPTPTTTDVDYSASDNNNKADIFLPLEEASPLGCAIQWQFCSQNVKNCSPLGGYLDILGQPDYTHNDTQAAYFRYFTTIFSKSPTIDVILQKMGPTSLESQSSFINTLQGPLPSDQWQRDVIQWFEIEIAAAQMAFLETAYYNPTNTSFLDYRESFTREEAKLCQHQKFRSTAHSHFSVFGLLFTFIVGLAIIAVSLLLEPLFWLLYKRLGYREYATLEWTSNTTLQLQRLAHERAGFGVWSRGTGRIPVTGHTLGRLDLSDPSHPVLDQRVQDFGTVAFRKGEGGRHFDIESEQMLDRTQGGGAQRAEAGAKFLPKHALSDGAVIRRSRSVSC
ncbi:hypothetical protein GGR57DRAFT_474134 [Xylariaceae sp. FL1272]|nr:hypothetical protein GGR57DRAFT_474134 [Xylariaceae sp. FL1272]